MPLLILFPILGVVLFLKRKCTLLDSTAILHTVSLLILFLYFGSLLGLLYESAWCLIGIGIILLFLEGWHQYQHKVFHVSAPFLMFLILPLIYWLIHARSQPIFWDEYSHWGVYVREIAVTNQLWTIETNSAHPDYPPGAALWQYWFTILGGYNEGTVYLGQFVLMLSPLLVLFERINLKQLFWIPALLAMLALGLANFGHGIVSLYTDHILSVWYAGILLNGLLSRSEHFYQFVLFSLPLTILLLIKDAGIPLVLSGIFFLICMVVLHQYRLFKKINLNQQLLFTLILLLIFPLAIKLAWDVNRKGVGVISQREGTGLIKVFLTEKTNFSKSEFQVYKDNFIDVFFDQQLSKDKIMQDYNAYGYRLKKIFQKNFKLTLFNFIILYLIWAIFLVKFIFNKNNNKIIILTAISLITLLVYILIIYITYPLLYNVDYAQNLSSFLRYAHTMVLPLYIFSMGLLAPAFSSHETQENEKYFRLSTRWLFGVGLLAFYIFEAPYLRPFVTTAEIQNFPNSSALRWRNQTDGLIEKIRQVTGQGRLWAFLPIPDNGFLATVVRYQFTPTQTTVERNQKFFEKNSKEMYKIWENYDYLWFAMVTPRINYLFEKKISKPLSSHRFVKVDKQENYINFTPVELK